MDTRITDKIVQYIVNIPQLLFAGIFSLLSGYIWLWIIYSYLKNTNKGSKHLSSLWAKIGLGILWYSLFMLPAYCIKFGVTTPVDGNIIQLIGLTIIIGSFSQAIATILIIKFKK